MGVSPKVIFYDKEVGGQTKSVFCSSTKCGKFNYLLFQELM